MNVVETARYLIDNNIFMTIATADANGKPWSSPVGYAYDEDYNFYWVSSKEALHSLNIAGRSEVSLSILSKVPDTGYDGLYVDAIARELTSEAEIQTIIDLFHKQRPQPPRFATNEIAEVTGDAAWRMYRATPVAVYRRADSILNGQAITIRESVDLKYGC